MYLRTLMTKTMVDWLSSIMPVNKKAILNDKDKCEITLHRESDAFGPHITIDAGDTHLTLVFTHPELRAIKAWLSKMKLGR